ncbi:hypothetical protein TcG_11005 [Trypanosoma cruzi]|nr:hypothetical protein TcG_11005 [Trypanosoma cruzi]
MPLSMHGKAATSIPLQRDAVINELHRVCNITEMPRNHLRAPLLFNIELFPGTLWAAITWNFISQTLPTKPLTMSGARLLVPFTPLREIVILNYGWTVPPLSLNSHPDPLHYYTNTPQQMISLWRSIVQQPAGSHAHIEQSALPLKMDLDILYLLVLEHPNPPHESWWQKTPCRQLRRSVAHWPCEPALVKEF